MLEKAPHYGVWLDRSLVRCVKTFSWGGNSNCLKIYFKNGDEPLEIVNSMTEERVNDIVKWLQGGGGGEA